LLELGNRIQRAAPHFGGAFVFHGKSGHKMLYNFVMVVNPMADRTQKTLPKTRVQLVVNLAVCEGERITTFSSRVLILPAKRAA
jgi:hypothetical protein